MEKRMALLLALAFSITLINLIFLVYIEEYALFTTMFVLFLIGILLKYKEDD